MRRADLDAYFRSRKSPGPMAFAPGQRVCYTRYFLLQLNTSPTSSDWRRRGTVKDGGADIVSVAWDDVSGESRINSANLALAPEVHGPNLRASE